MNKIKKIQTNFGSEFDSKKEFGGALLKKSHAKSARPIAIKKTMHLTLRSSKARGELSFLFNRDRRQKIEKTVRVQAQKFGVEIFRYANVGNHLHLLVKAGHREGFKFFLRAISGIIARIVLGTQRGPANYNKLTKNETMKASKTTPFWDQRPWTRVLFTWTEFKNVKKYVEQNFSEALGFAPYKPRRVISTA